MTLETYDIPWHYHNSMEIPGEATMHDQREHQPLISVIIPVYNVQQYLVECVSSITNQTYKNLEIILIDDGSTDGSSLMCDDLSLRDSRIVVKHQHNKGQSGARNTGLSLATGEFVYFLDSDDYVNEHLFEIIIPHMKHNNLDLCFFSSQLRNETTIPWSEQAYIKNASYGPMPGTDMLKEQNKRHEYSSCVYLYIATRNLIQQHSLRFVEGIYYEDNVFTFKILCFSKLCAVLPNSLHYRRLRSQSIMTTNGNSELRAFSYLTVIREFHEIPVQHRLSILKSRMISSFYISALMFSKNNSKRFSQILLHLVFHENLTSVMFALMFALKAIVKHYVKKTLMITSHIFTSRR